MSSSGVIRLSPVCKLGYIVSSNLHVVCEGCLGAEHACQAMTPQASCLPCKLLLAEEKQRRLDLFSSAEEMSQPSESCPLDEFLNARLDLDMSASEGEMASSCAPSFRSRDWRQSCRRQVRLKRSRYRPPPSSRPLAHSSTRSRRSSRSQRGL